MKYSDFVAMLRARAWHYARSYNMDQDELFCEANLAFIEAVRDFEPDRASFSTFLFSRVSGKLSDFCRREHRRAGIPLEENHFSNVPGDAPINDFLATADLSFRRQELARSAEKNLTDDAREVLGHLCAGDFEESPTAANGRRRAPSVFRAQQYMRKKRQWSRIRTAEAWEDIGNWYGAEQ